MNVLRQRKAMRNWQRGSGLIELMVAMLVLAVGLGGVTTLLVTAMATNNRNNKDTSAALLAQLVIEQISAQHIFSTQTVAINDCAGTQQLINAIPGAAGTGNGAALKADGTINFAQDSTTLLANNYAMEYVDCANAAGIQTVYDVRWNVMFVSGNTTTRMITTAARPLASNVSKLGSLYFALPVNLRGIGAPTIGE